MLLTCLSILGCGDPETSRLPAGSNATVYHETEKEITVHAGGGIGLNPLAVGTLVRVVDDADPKEARDVRINILEGPLKGEVISLFRKWLRPAR